MELEAAEVNMLSFSSAVTRVDWISDEGRCLGDEARLRKFGRLWRRGREYLARRMLRLDLAARTEIYGCSGRGGEEREEGCRGLEGPVGG